MTRICKKCGIEKHLEQFATGRNCSFGKRHTCTECQRKRLQSYAEENKEHIIQLRKSYYQKNRDRLIAKQKAYYDGTLSEVKRQRDVLNRYGWTPEHYNFQFVLQGGKCAICRQIPRQLSDGRFPLVIDHDHKTGAVRALLCHGCNKGLGHLNDSPELLRAAADYIEKHRSPTSADSLSTPVGECLFIQRLAVN